MSPRICSAVRTTVIAGGVAVGVAALLNVHVDQWPIYVAYLLLSTGLLLQGLEVLPGMRFAIAEMAVTIGFVYIAGLPIIVLHWLAPVLARELFNALPLSWRASLRPDSPYRDMFFDAWIAGGPLRIGMIAEWANFSIGLAARVAVAAWIFAAAAPIAHPAVILAAELVGYPVWGALSALPIYPDRALVPVGAQHDAQTAFADVTLVVVLALTPFVFLIAYGYQLHGLAGAVGWSVGTLGLHFMLQRLHERRLHVEEQNRSLAALNRELEHRERLSAIGKMSSVVSHQILQQLGVIGLYADLIQHTGADGDPVHALEEARGMAGAIQGALADVNRVLTDLLVFSRDLRLNLYAHPLRSIIEEVVTESRDEAAARSIALRVNSTVPTDVTVDKLKLKQAVLNVVRNALHASPAGGEIVISAVADNGQMQLAIADQGAGVPEKDREAIFTPFFTTKEHGTGLGLAIARAFVEAHGGRIWVDSHAPNGAVFRIQLPIAAPTQLTSRQTLQ